MILWIYILFASISIVLIAIGLSKPTESAMALIGFTFLFLLSFTVSGHDLEYKTGEQINRSYDAANNTLNEITTYTYNDYNDETGLFNAHRFGYFLAVVSIIGFTGTLISLKGGWRQND